ncbi:hypothetical protein JOE44_002831 [Chryseobacterium sp. PvR013]|nr:hypothetical protein [Chryseobacterium sp. PvR013]
MNWELPCYFYRVFTDCMDGIEVLQEGGADSAKKNGENLRLY